MANKRTRIVVTGGGTGGHITPLLAVVEALHAQAPRAEITYIGERGGKFQELLQDNGPIKRIKLVSAGKWRRYHGVKAHQVRITERLKNIRDFFFVIIGFFESLLFLSMHRPKVVFSKGGFVALPVGIAAALLRIPIVTHDSDSVPGLTNRVLSRWAVACAVGMPIELYNYPAHKLHYTGVPIRQEFYDLNKANQKAIRAKYNYEEKIPIILVTGGSQGAAEINSAMVGIMSELAKEAYVIHHAGKKHADEILAQYDTQLDESSRKRVVVEPFIYDMPERLSIADIVITRASATSLAELQALGKASIIVPSPILAEGHQLKNAESLESQGAALVLQQQTLHDNPSALLDVIRDVLQHPEKKESLERAMRKLARPHAAEDIAKVILEVSGA